MTRHPNLAAALALAMVMALSPVITACSSGSATPRPALPARPAATLAGLPTRVPDATETPTVVETANQLAETLLPADPDAVVVQIARVTHSPWEPAILAQMTPGFSLQASGFGVFAHDGGPSLDGWYQTRLSTQDTLGFVRRLVDDIGVLDIADQAPEPKIVFETKSDGSARSTAAVTIIYVRTAEAEGRLVIQEAELARPTGRNAARIGQLRSVIGAVEAWKTGASRDISPQEEAALAAQLGWSSTVRQPYTPDRAVALGTQARLTTPDTASSAAWGLEVPLAESLAVPFGRQPGEVLIQGQDVLTVLRAERERPATIWGPLWRDGGRAGLYIVGIRPAPPGSNHVVFDYTYRVPPPRLGLEQ